MRLFLIVLLTVIWLFVACDKNPSGSKVEKKAQSVGAFIVNEGNFGKGNGSLSFYSFKDQSIQNDVFATINKRPLGDTPNSMTVWDTLGFIVVNNSNKIEVISLKSWKSVKTIEMSGGSSPRNLAVVSDQKAYVTNLYANNVAVIDLKSLSLSGKTITVGANPEEIVVLSGKAYVANSGFGSGNTISVIDAGSDKVVRTIKVGDNPTSLIIDEDNEINVLCTGRWPAWGDSTDKGTNGGVYVIDPVKGVVVDSIKITGHPSELSYGGNDLGFFILNGKVVSYSTDENKLLNESLIDNTKEFVFYYSLEADPVSQLLFVLDAKNYAQNGELLIFDFSGNLQKRLTTGIIPGAVTFVYE
ncbi:MAG: hypothetical protein GXO77_00575 [Calditrichaeota bacterium]|nr:hypothetical protein [Calditrichota bacterium]